MNKSIYFLVAFFTISIGFSQPVNDDICNASFIFPGNTCGYQTYDNFGATASGIPETCYSGLDHDIWIYTIVPSSGNLNIDIESNELTDMVMMIYQADSCNGTLTSIYCSFIPNSLQGLPSKSLYSLTPGDYIYIRIADYYKPPLFQIPGDPYDFGSFDVCVNALGFIPPGLTGNCNSPAGGDDCANATALCSLNGYCGTTNGYTDQSWATLEQPFCGSIENNSFFTIIADHTSMDITMTITDPVNACPTGMQFYAFSLQNCGDSAQVIHCESPISVGVTNFNASGFTVGEEYYIMLDGYAGDICDYTINSIGSLGSFYIEGANTFCLGDTISLQASSYGNGVINWTGVNMLDSTGINMNALPASPGTYSFVAEALGASFNCGSNIDTFIVEVVSNNFNVSNNINYTPCSQSIQLEVITDQTHSVSWFSQIPISQNIGNTITVNSSPSNVYYAMVTDTNGCFYVDTITVNSQVLTIIDTSVYINGSSLVANETNASYQWLDCNNGNSPIAGEISQTFNPVSIGSYSVIVSNGTCIDTSNCHYFGTSSCIFDLSVTSFNGTLESQESSTSHQWLDCGNGNSIIVGETLQSYSPSIPGYYSVILSDGFCVDTTDCYLVDTVSCSLDLSVLNPFGQLVSNEDSALYQWVQCDNNFTVIQGETDQTFFPTQTGVYGVILTQGACVDTSTCILFTYTACNLDTSVTTINEFLFANQDTVQYQWIDCSNGNQPILTGTSQFFNPPYESEFAVVLSYNGCVDTSYCHFHDGCNDLMINVTSLVQPSIGNNDGEIEFMGYGGTNPYSYLWGDGYTDSIRTQLDSGIYHVQITDSDLCQDYRLLYLYNADTSVTAIPPSDTLASPLLDICVPFNYTHVFIYDYFKDNNGDLIVRWAFVDSDNNVFMQSVNYGVYPSPLTPVNIMFEINFQCLNGNDNTKSVETYRGNIFFYGSDLSLNEFDIDYKIYPNPTSGKIRLVFPENIGPYKVIIRNLAGQILKTKSFDQAQSSLNLDYAQGTYFIEIITNQGRIIEKIIKN